MIEKDIDIEFFYSLLEVQKSKELDNKSKLKVKSDMYEVVILDAQEIDKNLEDVMNVEKQVECLECEKWPEEIRKKVEELEKLEIIGNIPIRKYNKKVYKLEIINAYITIKTQDLAYHLEDRKELKMHVNKLLELKVIRESTSRHTSLAFIVNNHSELKRDKSRMIIN